jgi:hypothetical protein
MALAYPCKYSNLKKTCKEITDFASSLETPNKKGLLDRHQDCAQLVHDDARAEGGVA